MAHSATQHYYHARRMGELKRLYWAHTVKELAGSLATIFIPLYLYRLGYSLTEIFAYFLIGSIAWGLLQAPILHLAGRIGFNRSMGLGLLVEGLQILMLATLTHVRWPLWSIAVVWGLAVALYWPQFRANFALSLLHRRVGPAVGVSAALLTVAVGIAPAIGGAIASWLGISILYGLSLVLFMAAAVPLFMGPELVKRGPFSLRKLPWLKVRRDLTANLGSEVDGTIATSVWPLFIFMITPTYVGVGLLSSIGVIASVIIALYVSRRQSRGMSLYLKHGVGVVSVTNAIRLLAQSVGQIAGINFFNGLGEALIVAPFFSRYYGNAENEPHFSYVYAMQIAAAMGDTLLFGSLLLLSLVLSMKAVLIVGLLIAVPASYAMRLIREPKAVELEVE